MVGPLLDVPMWCRVADARASAPCQEPAECERFVATSTACNHHYTVLQVYGYHMTLQVHCTIFMTLHYTTLRSMQLPATPLLSTPLTAITQPKVQIHLFTALHDTTPHFTSLPCTHYTTLQRQLQLELHLHLQIIAYHLITMH